MKTTVKKKIPKRELTASKFIALSDAEKERIYHEIDSKIAGEIYAESRPMNLQEKAQWKRIRSKIRRGRGRPRLGDDLVRRVSVSVERSLLDQIDDYAKANNLNRSELIARGVASYIGAGSKL